MCSYAWRRLGMESCMIWQIGKGGPPLTAARLVIPSVAGSGPAPPLLVLALQAWQPALPPLPSSAKFACAMTRAVSVRLCGHGHKRTWEEATAASPQQGAHCR